MVDRVVGPGAAMGGRNPAPLCALTGLLVSVLFTFVVHPRIASAYGAVLDPDGYAALGWGLWKDPTFSYYPSVHASVSRGPLYPAFVAILLRVSGGWWPYSVQVEVYSAGRWTKSRRKL